MYDEYERIRTNKMTMIGEGGTGRVGLLGKKCLQIKTDCETKSSLSFLLLLSFAFTSVLCISSIHLSFIFFKDDDDDDMMSDSGCSGSGCHFRSFVI